MVVGHVVVVVLQGLAEMGPSVAGLDSCSSFQALVASQEACHVDVVEVQAFGVEIQGVSFQVAKAHRALVMVGKALLVGALQVLMTWQQEAVAGWP